MTVEATQTNKVTKKFNYDGKSCTVTTNGKIYGYNQVQYFTLTTQVADRAGNFSRKPNFYNLEYSHLKGFFTKAEGWSSSMQGRIIDLFEIDFDAEQEAFKLAKWGGV